jgi:hypothetical protein
MRHVICVFVAMITGCDLPTAVLDVDEHEVKDSNTTANALADELDHDSSTDAGDTAACQWRTETVVSGQNLNPGGLAVDPSGGVHVLFYDGSGSLQYTHRKARSHHWNVTTLAPQLGSLSKNASLAIDAGGTLHASFARDPGQLLYARRIPGGPWDIIVVDPGFGGTGTGLSSALAVDDTGEVHIAYSGVEPFEQLMYARGTFPNLATMAVPTAIPDDPIGLFPSIQVDADKNVHVTSVRFSGGSQDDLLYSYLPFGGSWSTTQVDTLPETGLTSSIEVDRTGGVHIAYDDRFHLEQRYAYKPPGGSWSTSSIDVNHVLGRQTIRVDSSGQLHIIYIGGLLVDGERVRHASAAIGGAWMIDAVGSDIGVDLASVLAAPSMVIDSRDQLHALYRRGFDSQELRHAHRVCR